MGRREPDSTQWQKTFLGSKPEEEEQTQKKDIVRSDPADINQAEIECPGAAKEDKCPVNDEDNLDNTDPEIDIRSLDRPPSSSRTGSEMHW